jgi:hypothetical protein
MNRQEVTKCPYVAPHTEVCLVRVESLLNGQSPIGGGHHDAEDGPGLEAKQQWVFDDEDVPWGKSRKLWED